MKRYLFTRLDYLSYSQSGEDRIVHNALKSLGKKKGIVYLDIGAHHPVKFSNTYLFYKLGGRGVTIEPNVSMAKLHRRHRTRDTLVKAAFIEGNSDKIDFFHFEPSTMSTADPEQAAQLKQEGKFKLLRVETVPTVNAGMIVNKLAGLQVDFMSVDIEGEQLTIIKSLASNGVKPLFICCETVEYNGSSELTKSDRLISEIRSLGYDVYADTLINTIFVQQGLLPFKILPERDA